METKYTDEELIKSLPNFTNNYAEVNGTKLHYVVGGQGEPLVLIPGYPETWWAYHKVMPILAEKYCVVVVDIRGMGGSDKPVDGHDKRNMAKDIFELVQQLGLKNISIAGHDIGAHVAFSFAANYSNIVTKLIILDTPHPDAGMYHLPMLPVLGANHLYPWWLAFNQVKELPEQLLEGRMNIVIEWLFNHLLKDVNSVSDFDKSVYASAYNSTDAIRASNGWYQAFPQDIEDSKTYNRLTMPVLGIGGSGYEMLQMSLPNTTTDLQLKKIENSGHFILTEKPNETAKLMIDFLG
ncbi:alpha/beta fold hydrolase [Elizabethkingia anophelis]|uniref:alpha/beta fold hydrolase n=1 Tax=Elizabethkingia anophelis TaxID=1117645 RepID=UPI0021A30F46|nr:alpha/beta hydrolase [Elizabethkingia anophelis]MCT3648404.1 alpha/beta hydrolase [Elizabethkingia anophelis]MCT3695430.1 alpha/beta hydrolase [Elizabethkingia anophelis]MCT3859394.1 alpha/beta hydrolase [Elizabethkingia anophelis]MCT3912699.1 alpha/beta hydrolase [Elizabethkingia anophelis]MCT4311725.1 alpha/beta hydrolase [Elizabethkingia anophelis]